MKLGAIALKIRSGYSAGQTDFGDRIAGAAELAIALRQTLNNEQAFVVPLSDNAAANDLETDINQVITESFGVIVALKNDSSVSDKIGLTAYDRIHNIRAQIWKTILNWNIPASIDPNAEGPIEYAGGTLLDINRGWLWYQFAFSYKSRIDKDDGVEEDPLPAFLELYAQYILGESQKHDNLADIVGGQPPRLPADSDKVDAEQSIKE